MRTTGRAGWLVAAPLLVVLWLALAPTALGGGTTYVITHGISMKPRFSSGDLAVRKHTDTVHLHLPSLQARADAAGEVIGAEPGKSLSVDDATTVQQATTAPRSVGLGPVRLPVGPARKLALGLLLAGLAVGFGNCGGTPPCSCRSPGWPPATSC